MRYRNIGALVGDQQTVTLPPSATVMDAAQAMAGRRVGAVAVIEDRQLVGLFTERDLLSRVIAQGRQPDAVTLSEVMTGNPVTIDEKRSLVDGLEIMFSHKFRHLPVLTDDGRLLGVMSCRDVPAAYQLMRESWLEAHGRTQLEPAGASPQA